ncbi:MAG: helix-turn-helix domain-containing protein [Actinomycetota bacterium]
MASGGAELIDVRAAAQLAHRSPETIRRWVWSGRLAAQRQGNRLVVARSDVQRLSRAGTQPGGRETPLREPLTWTEWSRRVREARRSGALPAGRESAADLVLADRATREPD